MKILNNKSSIFIAVGIVCIAILLLSCDNKHSEVEDKTGYEETIEQKLTELISGLGGISNVKVMVVQECGTEYIYAVDKENSGEREQIKYYSAGEEEALLIKEISPVIKGVAVVCDSNSKSSAKARITELISSVLDIPSTRIFVDT